ncbi:MAG TPA: hypothetical protein VNI84_19860 [Pyrinomonadaceae bacterium]|nr:hypothetical protein [Pyrinomonadaceae bacterium]
MGGNTWQVLQFVSNLRAKCGTAPTSWTGENRVGENRTGAKMLTKQNRTKHPNTKHLSFNPLPTFGRLGCGERLRQPVATTSFTLLLIKKLLFIFIAFLPMLVLLLSKTI